MHHSNVPVAQIGRPKDTILRLMSDKCSLWEAFCGATAGLHDLVRSNRWSKGHERPRRLVADAFDQVNLGAGGYLSEVAPARFTR